MARVIRIRLLMLSGQLGAGGAPKVVLNIARHLPKSVDDMIVGYLGGRDDIVSSFEDLGVRVVRLGDGMRDPSGPGALWRLVSTYEPTIIHTHMISAATWGRIIGRLRGIPVVSTIHTAYDNRPLVARMLDLSTSALPAANAPVSNSVADSLPPYFGLGSRSKVVHNCVDTEEIRASGDIPWSSTEWTDDIDESQPIIVNVTRFDPKKRKVDLVRALPVIQEAFPNAVVVLTGWGPRRRHVEDVARSLGVDDSVAFVGHVPNPYTVYQHSDVVALPSTSEGFSIGVLEAMAFGKPIAATDIPPFREALGSEYPLVPTRAPNALAEAIISYLEDSKRASELGAIARERVERRFSGRVAARSYLDIYRSIGR